MNEKMSKLIPLLDGDILVYRCGFSADSQAKKDGVVNTDYLNWALANTKTTVENILSQFPQAETFTMYLNGEGNFRDETATIQKYKGNRDELHKPKYYSEIKTYLIHNYGAVLVDGRESDDALGCHQFAHPDRSTCIVSIDKDLNMIPGYHYNWVKEDFYNVSMLDANLMFYRQMLEGDRTDNIPGIRGVGPKTVDKLFKEYNNDLEKIKLKVEYYYEEQYQDGWEMAYDEVGKLLFIQREEGKTYSDYGL